MDVLWILFAFTCGLGVKLLGLPPLIGFLAAGFLLNYAGVQGNVTLDALANLGITLMLFTIGLKLNVRDLLKREVWAGTLVHMGAWCIAASALLLVLLTVGLSYFAALDARAAALLPLL